MNLSVPNIAFVACNRNPQRFAEDPSFIYRCENLAAALSARGCQVWLGHISRFPWHQRFDRVVFHRPRSTWRFRWLFRWLRARGIETIAEFDDLVFDPGLAGYSPAVVNGLAPVSRIEGEFAANRAALQVFQRVSVSTEPLREAVSGACCDADIRVLPNAVHWRWLDLPEAPVERERKVIGYFPGTRSHDRDFALVAKPLARFLDSHPEVELCIVGPLQFSLPVRAAQLSHEGKRPFHRFHECFRDISVNIAPLEQTPFTRCKSALKVVEGGFWSVPTVCSPLPDAARFADRGDCLVAEAEDFDAALERVLSADAGIAFAHLRERVLAQSNIHEVAGQWMEWTGLA